MKEQEDQQPEEVDQRGEQRLAVGYPAAQGLYDPQFERDACGMGFVVDMHGRASQDIVQKALAVVDHLTHRGAKGAEATTGDGAGMMVQIPHQFLQKVCQQEGFTLPEPGHYGVGMVFLSPNDRQLRRQQRQFAQIVAEEGQQLLGWRTVPTNNTGLGASALAGEPFIQQVFIQKNNVSGTVGRPATADRGSGRSLTAPEEQLAFERKLFVIRKRAEREIEGKPFYVASLSSRTLVYKGMLLGEQLGDYFPDLHHPDFHSAIALVHSRFSTNTFPSWERAHPYRYVIHNGEINTVQGNVNWLRAREKLFATAAFGDDLPKVLPLIDPDGSDTAMFDNCLEFLALTGRSLPHAVMMMIPEPWEKNEEMCDAKKAFYEFHSHLMEPWDGPASIGFSDGTVVGAVLDRNGLRPSRYTITKDGLVIMASETGVVDIPPENVAHKGRLQPGRMLLVDTAQGRLISDEELKHTLAEEHPYRDWINQHTVDLSDLPKTSDFFEKSDVLKTKKSDVFQSDATLTQQQQAFGYTFEDLRVLMAPMARDGQEAIGSMGDDTPLAILSDKPQPLYNYFKQLFAQVTNPPLDAIREELVTSTLTWLGAEGNLLDAQPADCRRIRLPHPILTDEQLAQLQHIQLDGFKSATLPILYDPNKGGAGLEQAMQDLFFQADEALQAGANLLILSDRNVGRYRAGIPALLATAGLHHHLIRSGQRTRVSLILESGEPREVHHFAVLFGYGADAVNPYLAYATIGEIIEKKLLTDVTVKEGVKHYIKAISKGVVKTMSKMGISTIQSYRGAQIFEALGLHKSVVNQYFTGAPSRIQGADINLIAKEVEMRHKAAFPERPSNGHALPPGGRYQWREDGEHHLFNPSTIHRLQHAVRDNDYDAYQAYARDVNDHSQQLATLRGLFKLKFAAAPIPLEEVESVESICRRFKSGAMSYGSISKEAHEALARAMNAIGGKSNTGEGGEDPARFQDDRISKIKQVASGRFGVTSEYLVNAEEIQIKMAQGAKPGEGGQLPGRKVYPWIAKVRHSTPGVGLISPPPHHDIYSIEDLAQLIFDLKNANPNARINVKLVSEVGVGTIAAGVAKGHADVILISGHDGGTGASPQTSIKHAGLPWELGVAEAHQTLLMNGLRDRVVVETDGQLKTGRDVIIAALLGAEEFGFATAPLVALGCIMMRVCHLDTCPVGVATQNPDLRQKFAGKPEHVINFMHFIAQDMREIMAELGIRTIDELVGRADLLEIGEAVNHWKLRGLNLMPILYRPNPEGTQEHLQADGRKRPQQHGIDDTLDATVLLDFCQPAIEHGARVSGTFPIRNVHRTVGTMVGSAVTRQHGANGLPADSISLRFVGSAGQSFGAFVPKGMTLQLEGDANDYIGKGLSGGKIIVTPPVAATFLPEENIIVGNVAFYGATDGQAYIKGVAGERFCVRNSGVTAVVEGVGDHGCEYMTGGKVVVLGQTGRNFAAGMSGGVAYVLDEDGRFDQRCNPDMVDLEPVSNGDIETLYNLILCHAQYTDSKRAWDILACWEEILPMFVKVMPRDYKAALAAVAEVQTTSDLSGDDLAMAAFRQSQRVKVPA